jgi:hypothetical protein
MFKRIAPWIGYAAILVIIFTAIYATTQQAARNDANFPQIQIAQDTAASLNQGIKPNELVSGKVDIRTSLATFMIIYDVLGNVISGSGYIDNQIPVAPIGVLSSASGKSYNSVTWQPSSGIRIAAVTVAADKYYVLVGRSLKEVEKNADKTFQISLAAGSISMLILVIAFLITSKRYLKNN